MNNRDRVQMTEALRLVESERTRTHVKWDRQRHDFPIWLTVLSEEVGEVAQAVLRYRAEALHLPDPETADPEELRDKAAALCQHLRAARSEAAQVAAVAVAMIEHLTETHDDLERVAR